MRTGNSRFFHRPHVWAIKIAFTGNVDETTTYIDGVDSNAPRVPRRPVQHIRNARVLDFGGGFRVELETFFGRHTRRAAILPPYPDIREHASMRLPPGELESRYRIENSTRRHG